MRFNQELLTSVQSSDGPRSFAKEMRAWKTRSTAAGRWELATASREPSSKLVLLQLHEKWPENAMSTCHSRLAFEANWKGEKLDKCVPHELTENF